MSNEQLLALADLPENLRRPMQLLREKLANDEDGWRALLPIMEALATPSPQADKARGEVVAWRIEWSPGYGYYELTNDRERIAKIRTLENAPPIDDLYTNPQPQGDASPQRDRESDRRRFSNPAFNRWLDDGISDAGHTVWDAVGDVTAAWAGWEARQFAGDAVLIAECCGREECGGECGNEWLGMGLYRKPAEEAATQAPGGGELPQAFRDIRDWMEHCVSAADEGVDYAVPRDVLDALTAFRLMEKVGRNRWAPTTLGEEVASHALSATHTQARPDGGEAFSDWLAREIPPGTIISDPKWWAPRIASAYERTHPAPADVARLVDAASAVKSALAFGACPADKQIDLAEALAPFTTDKRGMGGAA